MRRIHRASHPVQPVSSCTCHPRRLPQQQSPPSFNQESIEQKRAELEWNHFFTLSSDILATVGFNGYFKHINPAAERILGFKQQDLLSVPFLEFVHPDDRAATISVVQKLMTGKRVDHFENRYHCQEGSYKWLSWRGIGIVEEELIYCTARDITASKQAEENLQQSKQYYETLIHSLNGIVWEFDLQTQQFVFVSQKAEEILGYPTDQWLTESHFWENHIHPTDREQAIHHCQQFVLQKQSGQLEYRMIAADGSFVWVHDIVTLVLEEAQPVKLRGVLIDITELQQTKDTLHQREQEFRALVENSPDVITRIDRNFRYLYVNPKIGENTGIPLADFIGKTSNELGLPEETVALWHRTAQRVFDTQQEQWMEFEIDSPTGHLFNHSRLVPEFTADGTVESVIAVTRDISEHKQLELALQESEARFRAFMQHNPFPCWITDHDSLLYANPTFLSGLKFAAESTIVGRKLVDIFQPDQAQQYLENNNLVVQSNQVVKTIETAIQLDGTIGEFLVYKFPILTASGQQLIGGLAIDITEMKQAEEALQLADFSFERSALAAVWIGRDARILRVNEESCRMLGYSREELQSKYVFELDPNFPKEVWADHWKTLQQQKTMTFSSQLQRQDGSLVPIETTLNYLEFNGQEYNFAFARDISDQLETEMALQYQREQEQLIVSIAQQIRQSLNLEEILSGTVRAVRELLASDRVLIYHLKPEIGGQVIAESVGSNWSAISGTIINDMHFNEVYAQLYQQGRVQAVQDIYTAGLTQCHIDLLAEFQVRANLAIPIIQEDNLWGLLVVQQCSAPREWQSLEIDLLKQLATQVAIAIQQSELYQQAQVEIVQRQQAETFLQQQAERERLLADTAQHIRQSLDLNHVLDTTVTEVRHLLQADRVLLYCVNPVGLGRVITESVAPEYPAILGQPLPPEIFPQACHQQYQQGRIRKITDIETDDELAFCLAETLRKFEVRSKLVVPILQGEKLWGLLIAHQCSGPRQWQSHEVDFLQQLATQVAISIQQAELHQQVRQLNANLEQQIQERTLELQQALEFEALLKRITDKVRDSLDEAQILQTAVQELALGLGVECCDTGLYDFEKENATVRFEYIMSGVPTAEGQMFSFSNLPEVYEQLLQGQYVQFCSIVAPVWWRKDSIPQFTILSCPLMDDQGVLGDLWLFKPCEERFNTLEVRLVEQVANQCAIAVRQSRLYQAAQKQVVELERLNQLKDDFLSTVSHELRTPMSNIKMAIQMLEIIRSKSTSDNPDLGQDSRYFNILRSECQREISLINDLLDLTRLDAKTEPLNLTTIDLQIWIPHVLEPFEQRIQNQQQQLKICIPTALPAVTTDLSYLERIITELLNNACKYTPAGEEIGVTVETIVENETDPNRMSFTSQKTSFLPLLITVYNTGVEIPTNELERIFDKFYRIPKNDPWKHGGTGLGLALVKRLVERLNGRIEASSCHRQTMFTIQLPYLNGDLFLSSAIVSQHPSCED